MKMIEQVAKAIGCIDADRCMKHTKPNEGTCDDCLEAGKRAIEAMREPTDAMIKAANFINEQAGFNNIDISSAAYKNMIDAALKE